MPLFVIIVGLVLLVSAVRGTEKDLFAALSDDFTGNNNFFTWVIALAILAALGSVKEIRPVTQGFLFLVLLVIFLQNKGIVQKFIDEIKLGTKGEVNALTNVNLSGDLNSIFQGLKGII